MTVCLLIYVGRVLSWIKDHKDRSLILVLAGLMLAGGVILLAADYAGTRQAVTDGVRRNSYGEGARREVFDVEVGRFRVSGSRWR